MKLRHWDSLLSRSVESSLDLSSGIEFDADDTFAIKQARAAAGADPATAEISGQAAPLGQATPGGDVRIKGGLPGTAGQLGGSVLLDVGPTESSATAPLSVQSSGSGIMDLLISLGRATIRAGGSLVLDLRSEAQIYLTAGTRYLSLDDGGLLSFSFARRFTMSGGQRQVLPAGGTGFSGTIAIDFDQSEKWYISLNGNATFSAPTNIIGGATYTIRIAQDATGNRTATWNSVFKFGALSGTLSTAPGAIDIFVFEGSDIGTLHCIIAAKGVHA